MPSAGDSSAPGVAVDVESDPAEPLLEAEVRRKVESLLGDRGWRVSDELDADYVLRCRVGIDDGVTDVVYSGFHYSPRLHRGYRCHGGISFGYSWYGYDIPYSYTYFTRVCNMTLYERAKMDDSDAEIGAVWACSATSAGTSSDLRTAVNYLLAASFKFFGADTRREVVVSFERDDPRVARVVAAGTIGP